MRIRGLDNNESTTSTDVQSTLDNNLDEILGSVTRLKSNNLYYLLDNFIRIKLKNLCTISGRFKGARGCTFYGLSDVLAVVVT